VVLHIRIGVVALFMVKQNASPYQSA